MDSKTSRNRLTQIAPGGTISLMIIQTHPFTWQDVGEVSLVACIVLLSTTRVLGHIVEDVRFAVKHAFDFKNPDAAKTVTTSHYPGPDPFATAPKTASQDKNTDSLPYLDPDLRHKIIYDGMHRRFLDKDRRIRQYSAEEYEKAFNAPHPNRRKRDHLPTQEGKTYQFFQYVPGKLDPATEPKSSRRNEKPAVLGAPYNLSQCQLPHPGWWCSRGAGHEGPCAARPSGTGGLHSYAHEAQNEQWVSQQRSVVPLICAECHQPIKAGVSYASMGGNWVPFVPSKVYHLGTI